MKYYSAIEVKDLLVLSTTLGKTLGASLCDSNGKESARSAGDLGSIPGSGGYPGEGNGNSLQYSCLENAMDSGALWATVHGISESDLRHD